MHECGEDIAELHEVCEDHAKLYEGCKDFAELHERLREPYLVAGTISRVFSLCGQVKRASLTEQRSC